MTKLIVPTEHSYTTLKECAQKQHKLRYTSYLSVIDLVLGEFNFDEKRALVWHKSCYSNFPSRSKIAREKKQRHSAQYKNQSMQQQQSNSRCWTTCTIAEFCLLCQVHEGQEKLTIVQTKSTSANILDAAQYDQHMQLRLAAVTNLIAYDGKYHLKYYTNFIRETSKNSECSQTVDVAMQLVVNELHHSAEQGHVL